MTSYEIHWKKYSHHEFKLTWVVNNTSQGSFFFTFLICWMINDEKTSNVRGVKKCEIRKFHDSFYEFKFSWKLKLSLELTLLCHCTKINGSKTDWTFHFFSIFCQFCSENKFTFCAFFHLKNFPFAGSGSGSGFGSKPLKFSARTFMWKKILKFTKIFDFFTSVQIEEKVSKKFFERQKVFFLNFS